ncbi:MULTISPECIES: amidohydrolase family protein [Acidobacteriaceae]|uniref:metal-dependent hydrolase family protein n=1 Tax=Acidobacteriaceae TaxID=204434 RepID=UPI00131E9412|nr:MULTISPECIES: amidohydrolase family protein [Acidobacteriaceae]MDW5265218.1 amidohydrolase family protein [Edaphobacter sp.]
MKAFRWLTVLTVTLFLAPFLIAQNTGAPTPQPPSVLFHNVHIFDGVKDNIWGPADVLVQGNTIAKISTTPITPDSETKVIDGTGRTLMPGLIDAHAHIMLAAMPMQAALTADIGYINLVAAKEAQATLLRGFTSLRDMGGPSFGLKRAIDQGFYPGPRIYPSGAMISQTGGHGDFRMPYEVPSTIGGPLSHIELEGVAMIADGPDQVLKRTREQLMLGASQIKLMAGGGVASLYDPLDAVQYTPEEIHAAVEAANNWNTYVAVHAYTPAAIQMAVGAGVKCIEHGQLADEATAKLMAEKGIWWSLQPFLDDEDANKQVNPDSRAKQLEVSNGTENAYRLAKKYKIKTAWGTDTLFSATGALNQNRQLTKLTRWYTPAEVLQMATHDNAELLALSGPRNPYPGKLGVVQEGALADLLLVQGDPVANIKLIETPETSFVVIMKNGKIYKDLLQ